MEERKLIWKIIGNGKSFFDKCKRDKINAYSAQSAFFIILSTIPFLMVFSSLLQYTPITEGTLLKMYQTALPDYISAFLISNASARADFKSPMSCTQVNFFILSIINRYCPIDHLSFPHFTIWSVRRLRSPICRK